MGSSEHSRLTVLVALAANAGVGVLKLFAGLITGSGALLSEAAHSAGDTATEGFLMLALRRSKRPADRVHPFGYGKERYFWSLIAAGSIFMLGAAFSVYEGISTIVGGGSGAAEAPWINFVVLGIAFCFEATSWVRARTQARQQTRSGTLRALLAYARDPEDPTVNSVLIEDSAALTGLVIAALGVGLHALTGSRVWDGAASLAIGALLILAAFLLARACERLLIGKQASARLMRAVERRLEEQPEVDDVVDLLTMRMGTEDVLLCVRLDFVDTFTASDLENACVRIDAELREQFDELGEIFLQPVPRADPELRERVLSRYGRVMADETDAQRRRAPRGRRPSRHR